MFKRAPLQFLAIMLVAISAPLALRIRSMIAIRRATSASQNNTNSARNLDHCGMMHG
jgi:hypothetical protein